MFVNDQHYRTVWMDNNIVYLINQPKLPHHFEVLEHHDTESVAVAIETMVVRGLVPSVQLGHSDWLKPHNWPAKTTFGPMSMPPNIAWHMTHGTKHSMACTQSTPL